MKRLYLLDTNTVSYLVNGKSLAARGRLSSLGTDEIAAISTITEGELRFGLARFAVGQERLRAVELLLRRLKVLAWDREAAEVYGTLRARQAAQGKSLGPLDTLIAAHAVSVGATLVTSDKAFRSVVDLVAVENWATDLV